MGNLTRAAYANQRMTLYGKLRQSKRSKRNTMIALRGQSTWRVFIIHVLTKAFGDASRKMWMLGNTPLSFSARGGGTNDARERERKR